MYLAVNDGRVNTIADVSSHYGISRHHLTKVANALSGLGVVTSTRGRGGGIALAEPVDEIVIGEIVRSVENDFHLVECHGPKNACAISAGCRLAKVLTDAGNAFLAVLDGVTLADLTRRNSSLRSLLRVA